MIMSVATDLGEEPLHIDDNGLVNVVGKFASVEVRLKFSVSIAVQRQSELVIVPENFPATRHNRPGPLQLF